MSFVRMPARLGAAGAVAAIAASALLPGPALAADALAGITGVSGIGGIAGVSGLVRPVTPTLSTVVLQRGGVPVTAPTRLLSLETGKSVIGGYTLDPGTAVGPGARYSGKLAPNDLSPAQLSKITWVLGQAAPVATTAAGLPAASGVGSPAALPVLPVVPATTGLPAPSVGQRTAATQAAIWHYSAGTDLVPGANPVPVESLYDLLTGVSNVGLPIGAQSLMSSPSADSLGNVRGTAGQLAGPFTVNPAIRSVVMKLDGPAGLRLVDGGKLPITTFRGGQKFYVDVPGNAQPGQATLTAVGAPQSALGRVVQGISTGDPSQLLVLAGRAPLPATQTSTIQWASGGLTRDVKASPRCVADGIGVELDNTARKTPLNAVVDQRAVTVPGGATKVVPVRVPEGEKYSIPVSDGVKAVRLTGVRHCSRAMTPVVTAAPDCAAGGMGVTIVNEDAAREAVMSVDGKNVRVPEEATKVVRVPADEGKPYEIDVVGQNGFSRTFSGIRDCATAQATDLKSATVASPASDVAAALPITGVALGIFLGGGATLLTLGAAVVSFARRRRRAI